MKSLAECMSSLKVLVLAGSMVLVPAAVAQQEVSPDIYGDSSPKMAQSVKPSVQARKQADAKKIEAASKHKKDSRKQADDRKLAAANHSSKNIVVAQAQ